MAFDQAYFKEAFFSGDRPGDLGQVRFPNDDGFLFSHVWGKTLRDGDQNVFGIHRNPQTAISPIREIELYMDVTRQIGIILTTTYLFRPATTENGVRDAPLITATAEAGLKLYLGEMKGDE